MCCPHLASTATVASRCQQVGNRCISGSTQTTASPSDICPPPCPKAQADGGGRPCPGRSPPGRHVKCRRDNLGRTNALLISQDPCMVITRSDCGAYLAWGGKTRGLGCPEEGFISVDCRSRWLMMPIHTHAISPLIEPQTSFLPWYRYLKPAHSQNRAQISYSSFVPRNLKSTGTISSNPSSVLGSLNREEKVLNASFGSPWRASGFNCGEGTAAVSTQRHHETTTRGEPRDSSSYLRIQGSHGIVMLAQLRRRLEPDASDGDFVFARKSDPLRAGIDVGICVVLCALAGTRSGENTERRLDLTNDDGIPFPEKVGRCFKALVLAAHCVRRAPRDMSTGGVN